MSWRRRGGRCTGCIDLWCLVGGGGGGRCGVVFDFGCLLFGFWFLVFGREREGVPASLLPKTQNTKHQPPNPKPQGGGGAPPPARRPLPLTRSLRPAYLPE